MADNHYSASSIHHAVKHGVPTIVRGTKVRREVAVPVYRMGEGTAQPLHESSTAPSPAFIPTTNKELPVRPSVTAAPAEGAAEPLPDSTVDARPSD
jgi:hypothetical protein